MTNVQLYLAVGLPILFNSITTVMLYVLLTKRMDDLQLAFNKRLDDMTALWRESLLRVEQVMDARLKHLEERRP
jgi:hypothetical protein